MRRQRNYRALLACQGQLDVMRVSRGEHQRCAFDGQDERVLASAVNLLRIDRMQRRELGRFDRRQGGDQHRFGIMEGRRCVQTQIEVLAAERAKGRDIHVTRGAKRIKDAADVENGGDVRAVVAVAELWRIARLHDQIAGGPGGQCLNDRGAVAVVQDEGLTPLQQTGRLQFGHALHALVVELDRQAPREQRGRLLQPFRIRRVERPDGGQVALQARQVQRRLIEVLGGPDERAGSASYGVDQSLEVTGCLGGEKDQDLLRSFGHRDEHSVARARVGPGATGVKPARRRRVRGAAQKRQHQEVVLRLVVGQVGFDPEPIPLGEARDLGRGQRGAASRHAHVNRRPRQIERCRVGVRSQRQRRGKAGR